MYIVYASNLPSASNYGVFIVETLAALALIALAAWTVVRLSNRVRFYGGKSRRIKEIERLSLDSRRTLHIVEVDGETMLLAVSDQSFTLLKTLSCSSVKEETVNSKEVGC